MGTCFANKIVVKIIFTTVKIVLTKTCTKVKMNIKTVDIVQPHSISVRIKYS